MDHILISNGLGESGQYVVTDGPLSKKVVAAAPTPREAIEKARQAGAADPVLIYVPRDDERLFVL